MNKFITENSQNGLTPDILKKLRLDKSSIGEIVKDIGIKAKIKTHIYPHLLRHASATNYARLGLNESEMRVRYGWSKTSNMPAKYIHLASADMDSKILKLHGLKPKEEIEKERSILSPKICPSCTHENAATDTFCSLCRMSLDLDAVRKTLKHRERVEQSVDILENYDPLVVDMVLANVQKIMDARITKKEEDSQKI